jgi:hypothetical protein
LLLAQQYFQHENKIRGKVLILGLGQEGAAIWNVLALDKNNLQLILS